MRRVTFVETSAGAASVDRSGAGEIVALTGEAVEALDRIGIRHHPVGALVDARRLVAAEPDFCRVALSLCRRLGGMLADRHPGVVSRDVLGGHEYHLQYAIGTAAVRAELARAAAVTLGADELLFVDPRVDPDLAEDGYEEASWLEVVRVALPACHVEAGGLERSVAESCRASPCAPPGLLRRAPRALARRAACIGRSLVLPSRTSPMKRGLRVLVADRLAYDWEPVLAALVADRSSRVFRLLGEPHDEREWTYSFAPELEAAMGRIPVGEPLVVDGEECEGFGNTFDNWAVGELSTVEVLGLDVLPGIRRHLRALVGIAPALARHSDALVAAALDVAEPDAVCCFSMPYAASARLAAGARARGIPVLSYQHGGGYGTHRFVQHELVDFALADVFLGYGVGVTPATDELGTVRARCLAVGSTLAAGRKSRERPVIRAGQALSILLIAESTKANALSSWVVVEDTLRYALERQSLETLVAAPSVEVTFRPFPGTNGTDGTSAWIERSGLPIRIVADGPLALHLGRCDVAIIVSASNTAWNEALALGVPLVVYCDPTRTPLTDDFAAALDEACLWCRDEDELAVAIAGLAAGDPAVLKCLRTRDAARYLERYVTGPAGGSAVDRALAVLDDARATRLGAAA